MNRVVVNTKIKEIYLFCCCFGFQKNNNNLTVIVELLIAQILWVSNLEKIYF